MTKERTFGIRIDAELEQQIKNAVEAAREENPEETESSWARRVIREAAARGTAKSKKRGRR